MRYEQVNAGLSLCDGARKGYQLVCRGTLYKCPSCGHTGCRQQHADSCSKQGVDAYGRCVKCGAMGAQALPA